MVALFAWPAGRACAQGRSAVVLNQPGAAPTYGRVGGTLSGYSWGLGELRRGGDAGGLLQSSISSAPNFSTRRGGEEGSPAGPLFTGGTLLGKPAGGTGYASLPNLGDMAPGARMAITPIVDLRAYQAAMEGGGELAADDKPITSWVPGEPSLYQTHMKRGEEAFRQGRWLDAVGSFEVAADLARYAPEPHLALLHANFAAEKYYSAAYQLRDGLKYFPQLPLARLQVRRFYGETRDFVGHVERLQARTRSMTVTADLWLVLAYFRYFDEAEADAVQALRECLALNPSPESLEAIQIFWDGMVAAGKAEGDLVAATQPGASTAPARRVSATRPPLAPPMSSFPATSRPAMTRPAATSRPATRPAEADSSPYGPATSPASRPVRLAGPVAK